MRGLSTPKSARSVGVVVDIVDLDQDFLQRKGGWVLGVAL